MVSSKIELITRVLRIVVDSVYLNGLDSPIGLGKGAARSRASRDHPFLCQGMITILLTGAYAKSRRVHGVYSDRNPPHHQHS
jgi:hypothetical protein